MDTTTKALIGLSVVVWGAAGFFALAGTGAFSTASGPAPTGAASPSVTETAPAPAISAPAEATAEPAVTAAPTDPPTCMASLLPEASFSGVPAGLGAICEVTNPLRGFSIIKTTVVRAAEGEVTPAMREWAALGWYEVAAFTLLRARCCTSPPALEWPFALACPMDGAVADLEAALRDDDDDEALAAALDAYHQSAICLSKFGQGTNFGQSGRPGPGRKSFDKMLSRR